MYTFTNEEINEQFAKLHRAFTEEDFITCRNCIISIVDRLHHNEITYLATISCPKATLRTRLNSYGSALRMRGKAFGYRTALGMYTLFYLINEKCDKKTKD